jgi:hypothetical protein
MSIIAHVMTPEGFVVGADGRGGQEAGQTLKNDLKRLIRVNGPSVNLVCGWTGVTRVPCEEGSLDLSAQMEMIGDALSNEQSGTRYIEKFFSRLTGRFDDELRLVLRESDSKGFFVGYIKSDTKSEWTPRRWLWDLSKDDEPKERPVVKGGYHITAGPADVLHGLQLDDPTNLKRGEDGLRAYIAKCIEISSEFRGPIQIVSIPRPTQ